LNVTTGAAPGGLVIVPFRTDLAPAFAELNREWIEQFFRMESSDSDMLDDPGRVLAGGGQIFFALYRAEAVGTAAAVRVSPAVFELAKMAVRPSYQGQGIGERLARAVIDYARTAGARQLFLETNSRLGPAIRLYERVGFSRATPPHPSPYARADVYMELRLSGPTSWP
jgi:GNAT superfamily N-acetyltransferase